MLYKYLVSFNIFEVITFIKLFAYQASLWQKIIPRKSYLFKYF